MPEAISISELSRLHARDMSREIFGFLQHNRCKVGIANMVTVGLGGCLTRGPPRGRLKRYAVQRPP